MEIREATEGDIPEIVELLKLSLGEGLMPKSEQYWRWKHIDNPFGRSPVLLCWDGPRLIGVRAFLRWQWTKNGEILNAVRAVDTATHPDYQGKGIFRKLTLSLAEYCTKEGDQFVFNTPNDKSRPGYLKMGWKDAGKLPIKITFYRPLNMLMNLAKGRNLDTAEFTTDIKSELQRHGISRLLTEHHRQSDMIVTNTTAAYLQWRYVDVPVARYVAVLDQRDDEINALLIGRIKRTKFGTELRIADCFVGSHNSENRLGKLLQAHLREWGIDYVAISGARGYYKGDFQPRGLKLPIGPIVTIRPLKMENLESLRSFVSWTPALGDLELF